MKIAANNWVALNFHTYERYERYIGTKWQNDNGQTGPLLFEKNLLLLFEHMGNTIPVFVCLQIVCLNHILYCAKIQLYFKWKRNIIKCLVVGWAMAILFSFSSGVYGSIHFINAHFGINFINMRVVCLREKCVLMQQI